MLALGLDEAINQIVNAAITQLEAARQPGGLIEDATDVVSGATARRRPNPPYLWVTVDEWTETNTHAIRIDVTVPLMVSAFTHSDSPEDGWLEAVLLATRARRALLADRRLGLEFVTDMRPVRGGPIGRLQDGGRFWAFTRLDVAFTILEPERTEDP